MPSEVLLLGKTREACLLAKDLLSEGAIIAGPSFLTGSGSMNVLSNFYSP
jgi:hypothetical protein